MKLCHLLAFLCLASMAALADSNKLLSSCQVLIKSLESGRDPSPTEAFAAGHCAGLVQAVSQLGQDLPGDMKSCTPDGMPVSQGVRVVVKWLKENPEFLSYDEIVLLPTVFNQIYPCKDSK